MPDSTRTLDGVPWDTRVYQFPEQINCAVSFRFAKGWIVEKRWAGLPGSSQSILPVIAAHCNWKGYAYPGQITIAALSGLSRDEVRIGLKHLEEFPGFRQARYVTPLGVWGRSYRLRMPRTRDTNRYFRVYKCMFEGGNWQALSRVARAVYPVLRYIAAEGRAVFGSDGGRCPDAEVCAPVIASVAEYAGVSRPSVYKALDDLERNWLVKYLGPKINGKDTWEVYPVPPKRFSPETLNRAMHRKFRRSANATREKWYEAHRRR